MTLTCDLNVRTLPNFLSNLRNYQTESRYLQQFASYPEDGRRTDRQTHTPLPNASYMHVLIINVWQSGQISCFLLLSFVAPLVCFCTTPSITWPICYRLGVFNILKLSKRLFQDPYFRIQRNGTVRDWREGQLPRVRNYCRGRLPCLWQQWVNSMLSSTKPTGWYKMRKCETAKVSKYKMQ